VVGIGDPGTDNNEQPVLNLKLTLLQFPPNQDYPNGAYLAVPGIDGQTPQGIQGLSGHVDNHYLQRYGSAAVLALVSAGVRMAAYQGAYGGYDGFYLSPQDAAAQGAGQVLGQVIAEELRRKLRIRPTVTVPMGYNFIATFQQIQEFPGAYRR
jgi:type IV secretion system protein VirB10